MGHHTRPSLHLVPTQGVRTTAPVSETRGGTALAHHWRHRESDRAYAHAGTDALAGTLSGALLLAALLLGGGTRNYLFSDLIVQLLAAILLIYGLRRLNWQSLDSGNRQLLLLSGSILALPVLQLLPMPMAVIQWFPGRAELWAARAAAGLTLPSFASWTLDPNATLAALRGLLPAAAIAVLGCQLSSIWLKRLTALVIVVAVVMVPLGIAQVAQGPHSELRPYTPTNVHDAVGLFANRNHYAALLAAALALVFVSLLLDGRLIRSRSGRVFRRIGWMLLGAMLLLGLVLSRSRAGVGLAGVIAIFMLVLGFVRRREHPEAFRWLLAFVVVGGLVAFQFGFLAIADRLTQNSDQRWVVLADVLAVSTDFAWLGTGLGSFPAIYAAHESLSVLGDHILNHAHNDWAELWVDLGVLLIPMVLWALVWFWGRARELVASRGLSHSEQSLRLAGGLVVMTLCLHSLVDYPLRTTAMSAVLALGCVLCAHPLVHSQRAQRAS